MTATDTRPTVDSHPRFEGEWETTHLGGMGDCVRGVGYDPERDLHAYDTEETCRLLRSTNVQGGRLVLNDLQFVDQSRVSTAQEMRNGDLLFCAANGSRALVGKSAAFTLDDGHRYTFGAFMGVFRPRVEAADSSFVEHLLQSRAFSRQVDLALSGSAINNLAPSAVESFQFSWPRLAEQRAIAAALSDIDDLLQSLDRLIAKKRDLRQGAMQQLLTGATRLPGFDSEWEVTPFAKVVKHHSGNSSLIKGKLPQSPIAGMFPGFSASGQDVWCDQFEFEGDAIIVSAVGSRCGRAFIATGQWCAIANTHIVWPVKNMSDIDFLKLHLNDESFWLKGGSGQPFVQFKKSFMRSLHRPPLDEQRAIASVLSDMDAAIYALEERRAKVATIKQGMMQELLTGRTRLPIPQES